MALGNVHSFKKRKIVILFMIKNERQPKKKSAAFKFLNTESECQSESDVLRFERRLGAVAVRDMAIALPVFPETASEHFV